MVETERIVEPIHFSKLQREEFRLVPFLAYRAYLTGELPQQPIDYESWVLYPPDEQVVSYHKDQKMIKLFAGANRSRKTFTATIEHLMIATACHPFIHGVRTPTSSYTGQVSDDKHREITIPLLERLLGVWKAGINERDLFVELPNKSRMDLMSYRSDTKQWASSGLTIIQYDEEPPQDKWKEGRMRAGGINPLRIIGGFFTFGMLLGQEEFKYLNDVVKFPPPHVSIYIGKIYDNPTLSKEYIEQMKLDYNEDEIRARFDGELISLVGGLRFNQKTLNEIFNKIGNNVPIKELSLPSGFSLKIWKDVEAGKEYIIPSDSAKGREKSSNPSAMIVFKRDNGEQVASISYRIEPEWLAQDMIFAGNYFNKAILVPENNSYGSLTVFALKKGGYTHLYWARDEVGFNTNSDSKRIIVEALAQSIRQGKVIFNDPETIREMLCFIRDGIKEHALGGHHDDLVMSSCIGNYVNQLLPQNLYINADYTAVSGNFKKTYTVRVGGETKIINREDYFDEEGNQTAHCAEVKFKQSDIKHGIEEEEEEDDY